MKIVSKIIVPSLLRGLIAAAFCGLFLALPTSQAHAQAQRASSSNGVEDAEIYLLRGLFGVFSLGMDSLAAKLKQQGYSPTVTMWDTAQGVTDKIIANHKAGSDAHIVLIGHSLGSDAVVQIAQQLAAQNIPVDLAVTFDITIPLTVPGNVAAFINFYQHNGFGQAAIAAPDFKGEFSNIDLSNQTNLNHGNIDEAPQLQAFVIDRIFEVTHKHIQTVQAKREVRTR